MSKNSLDEALSPILRKLDLSDDEAQVLSLMLQLGSRPASAIAKASGFGRGKIYNILTRLKEEHCVQEIVKNGSTSYSALPVEVLIGKLKEREDELHKAEDTLRNLIPTLALHALPNVSATKVEYWKGDAALQVMLDKLLIEPNSEIFAFLDYEKRWPKGRDEAFVKWDKEYTVRRTKKNIPIYVMCSKSAESDEAFRNREECKRYMKLVKGISFPIAIILHRTSVIITRSGSEVFGVAIHDPLVAEAALELFRSIWASLDDYR